MENDIRKLDRETELHGIALARGQKVMDQMSKTSDLMESTVDTMHDTVLTMKLFMKLFGKFLTFVAFPVCVMVTGNAIWSFMTDK